VLLLLIVTSAGNIGAADDGRSQLANEKLKVIISNRGQLLSVENPGASEAYVFESDAFELDTDLGMFSNRDIRPTSLRQENGRITYQFDYDKVSLQLIYSLKGKNAFFRRTLKIDNKSTLRVKNLVMGRTRFSRKAKETMHYRTFIAAPTVNFIRYTRGGLFTGIENPYFHSDMSNDGMTLSFGTSPDPEAGRGIPV